MSNGNGRHLVTDALVRLTGISPLPAWAFSATILGIWIAAAAGCVPAKTFWTDSSGSITGVYLGSLGIWLTNKAVTRVAESSAAKATAQAEVAKAEAETAKTEADKGAEV